MRQKRLEGLYSEDESKVLRKSHENPYIKSLYKEYLEYPNSHTAHQLLHTHYVKRGVYNELTDQRFAVAAKQPAKTQAPADGRPKQAGASAVLVDRHTREETQSVQVLALAAENAKLKSEMSDNTETIEILKNVIADYLKKER